MFRLKVAVQSQNAIQRRPLTRRSARRTTQSKQLVVKKVARILEYSTSHSLRSRSAPSPFRGWVGKHFHPNRAHLTQQPDIGSKRLLVNGRAPHFRDATHFPALRMEPSVSDFHNILAALDPLPQGGFSPPFVQTSVLICRIPGSSERLTGNGEKLTYSPFVGCNWLCLASVYFPSFSRVAFL